MTDITHEDRLVEAFTKFRAQAHQEIRPPGTHAVRRVVRRRRRIRVACSAAAVILAGAGAAVAAAVSSPDRTMPAVGPTLSHAELQQLAEQAGEVVFPLAGGGRPVAMTAENQGYTSLMAPGGSPLKYLRGDHDLMALCLGRGAVTVAWEEPGGQAGSARAVCDGDVVLARFTMRLDGPVRITLTADPQAIGRAGIAVSVTEQAITDPQHNQLRDLALQGRGRLRFSGWGRLDEPVRRTERTGFAAGTYVLRFACLGNGSVTAALTVGTTSESTRHSCRDGSEPVAVTVRTAGYSADATVTLAPDTQARQGQTLFAYNLGTG